jgi:hypothetical protein
MISWPIELAPTWRPSIWNSLGALRQRKGTVITPELSIQQWQQIRSLLKKEAELFGWYANMPDERFNELSARSQTKIKSLKTLDRKLLSARYPRLRSNEFKDLGG